MAAKTGSPDWHGGLYLRTTATQAADEAAGETAYAEARGDSISKDAEELSFAEGGKTVSDVHADLDSLLASLKAKLESYLKGDTPQSEQSEPSECVTPEVWPTYDLQYTLSEPGLCLGILGQSIVECSFHPGLCLKGDTYLNAHVPRPSLIDGESILVSEISDCNTVVRVPVKADPALVQSTLALTPSPKLRAYFDCWLEHKRTQDVLCKYKHSLSVVASHIVSSFVSSCPGISVSICKEWHIRMRAALDRPDEQIISCINASFLPLLDNTPTSQKHELMIRRDAIAGSVIRNWHHDPG